jgi:hypothetical protein
MIKSYIMGMDKTFTAKYMTIITREVI